MTEQKRVRLAEARASKQRAEKRVRWGGRQAPRVDLERLREKAQHLEWVRVERDELAALVAVVDAARHAWCAPGPGRTAALLAALEPFTPATDRAWEAVDRWNAERDLAVKAAVDETRRGATHEWRTMLAGRENYERLTNGPPPPDRDAIRDQLADAGVVVQRQFRSDQERIAELEARLAEEVALTNELGAALAGWEKP